MTPETRIIKRIAAGERTVSLQPQARCPECETWADMDDEQVVGEVSLVCTECGWHGYVGGAS